MAPATSTPRPSPPRALMRGFPAYEAARLAADFTVACIRKTLDDPDHWYGVKFERALPMLIERVNRP